MNNPEHMSDEAKKQKGFTMGKDGRPATTGSMGGASDGMGGGGSGDVDGVGTKSKLEKRPVINLG